MIGILAYGSLITDPGSQILRATEHIIDGIQTPFEVEYARKSRTRAYAPTIVPVELWQGERVNAQVFVLKPDIDEKRAVDMLYRRERDKVNSEIKYSSPTTITTDTVLIERLYDFAGIEAVFYTRIGANLPEIVDPTVLTDKKARLLACLAVESLTPETYKRERDGIQYLADNLAAGVVTPLSRAYEVVILAMAGGAPDLAEARERLARQIGLIQ